MKRVLGVCLVLSLMVGTVLSIGCGGDSGGIAALLGVITIAAIITASGGGAAAIPFAANMKKPAAQIRFAAGASKFKGKIKLNGVVLQTVDLTANADKTKLQLNTSLPDVSAGKQQISLEVYPADSTGDPILKAIVSAEVPAGDTTPLAPAVDFETTARALAYENWPASSTSSIDEFSPDATSINALATKIRAELIPAGATEVNPDAAFAYTAAVIDYAKTIGEATSSVYQKRLAGNYRMFTINAATANSWVSMSEATVTGDQLEAYIKIDPEDPINTKYTATVNETNGEFTFTGDAVSRGAVSPSGNYAVVHDWKSDDPSVSLLIKKPTAANLATVNGTYRCSQINYNIDNNFVPQKALTMGFTATFNNGLCSTTAVYDPDSDITNETNIAYTVSADGKVTLAGSGSNEFMQVSADGNVLVSVGYVKGSYCNLTIGLKEGGNSFSGSFLDLGVKGVAAGNYQSYSISHKLSASGSTITELDVKTEESNPDSPASTNYTVSNGAVVPAGTTAATAFGAIDPTGEVYAFASRSEDTWRHFSFGVKK